MLDTSCAKGIDAIECIDFSLFHRKRRYKDLFFAALGKVLDNIALCHLCGDDSAILCAWQSASKEAGRSEAGRPQKRLFIGSRFASLAAIKRQ